MIEKRVFGYMNQDDSDKDLKNGAVREIHNMVHTKGGFGNNPRLEMILGTIQVSNVLPSGTNKNIGNIEDVENEKLYYFNYNSLGSSGIYEYDPVTESVTKLIESALFPFTEDSFIRGSIADGMIFFTDNLSVPMYVNVDFAKAGSYLHNTIREFTYARPVANTLILAVRATDGNVLINRVSHDSYKFSYRLIYFDDGQSKISSYSKLVPADLVPPISESTNNVITINLKVEEDIEHLIKKIEFIYEKNNSGFFYIFSIEDRPSGGWNIIANPNGDFILNFDGTENTIVVPVQDYVDGFENIPRLTSDIIIKGNRLLMDKGLFGYDDEGSADISLSITSLGLGGAGLLSYSAKHGGIYSVGIIYEDIYGWKSPVLKKKSIQIPYLSSDAVNSRGIRIVITGDGPSWAFKWKIVVSEDLFYDIAEEIPVYIMPVQGRARADAPDGVILWLDKFILGGWIYYQDISSDELIEASGGITSIHLRMPTNIPFYPEKGMFGRFKEDSFISDPDLSKEFVIQDVVGDKIYIDNFGDPDTLKALSRQVVNIDIYKKKEVRSGFFYEVGIEGTLSALSHDDADNVWRGDFYYIIADSQARLSFLFESDPVVETDLEINIFGSHMPLLFATNIYSPTPTTGPSINVTPVVQTFAEADEALSSYTLDYKKIANDRSTPHSEGSPTKVKSGDVIIYSDPYLPNTLVNGFFSVGLLSEHTIGVEDGSIQRMFSIGERTVLAIHKHAVTSVYMGQGVLRSVDGDEIVSKSDDVIGYTNRAKGRYGSSHPESFAYFDDKVYFWDGSRGDVVRYAQNGVDPLGKANEFKSYLKQIADDRRDVPGGYRAYGMYNPEHEMYILSFPDASYGSVSLPAITLTYTEKGGKFVPFFGIYPEGGSKISDKMVVFNDGNLYQWNKSGYKFFGVDYFPKIVVVFNSQTEVEKLLRSFIIDSDGPWRIDVVSSNGATSHTFSDEFIEREKNKFYGDVYRDTSSSGAYPDTGSGGSRFNGDTIRGETFVLTLSRNVAGAVTISELMLVSKQLAGHLKGR